MIIYEELVKNLRSLAVIYCICGNENTNEYKLLVQAADAIEELKLIAESNERSAARWAETAELAVKRIPSWIPTAERFPDNGAEVLAWSESGFAYVDWWIDGKWKVNSIVDEKYEHVTHWMPLPEPPQKEEI